VLLLKTERRESISAIIVHAFILMKKIRDWVLSTPSSAKSTLKASTARQVLKLFVLQRHGPLSVPLGLRVNRTRSELFNLNVPSFITETVRTEGCKGRQ